MMNRPVKKIIIVGGGTAGWMAAASLSKQFAGKPVTIQLIESDAIGTVGVGEATVPGIRSYIKELDIRELEFIKATNATFKLGIEFKDWYKTGHSFFHPFAGYGAPIADLDFYQCWLQLHHNGYRYDLEDFCLGTQLARQNRFAQPDIEPESMLARYNYAYHFDASLFARFLRVYAEERGVQRREGKITQVNLDKDDGFITSVTTDTCGEVAGDLFVDCSGFRGLLIEETIQTGYQDWSEWLRCDRAVALQTSSDGEPVPYTRSTALAAGWQWTIPLQHRTGNGYVYCSQYLSDDEAIATLQKNVPGEHFTQPRVIKFVAGVRKKFWTKNCVALGLASGFIEPLESTSISLIQTGIDKLQFFLRDLTIQPERVAEANRLNELEYTRIRDFIVLHYKVSQRDDTPFWREVRNMSIPESLQTKIEAFKRDGSFLSYEQETFLDASWLSMYNGFNIVPVSSKKPIPLEELQKANLVFNKMRAAIATGVDYAPLHSDFLREMGIG
jgi:tryptophan 7-halogenase